MAYAELIPVQKHILAGDKDSSNPSGEKEDRASQSVSVSRETIESIKRTLYNAIDRLERMSKQ
jgi:hypothetical protein